MQAVDRIVRLHVIVSVIVPISAPIVQRAVEAMPVSHDPHNYVSHNPDLFVNFSGLVFG